MVVRKRLTALLTGAVACAVVLTACSSSTAGSSAQSSSAPASAAASASAAAASSAEAPASSAAAQAVSGDPVKLGIICSCSGAFASSLGGIPDLAKAWTDYTNANGGINGHPVEIVVADDAADASKSQQLVKKLVEEDKVLGIVDESASFDATWADYVTKAGVPVTGGVSFTQPMTTNANFFPTGGTLAAVTWGLIELIKDSGKLNLALFPCAEAPLCDGYGGQITRISDALDAGVNVVYQSKIAATDPNYTAKCLAAKDAGADSMYAGHAGQIVERMVNDCVAQGYTPAQFQVGGDVTSSWAKNPNMNGVQIAQLHLPMNDTSTQGGQIFNEAVAQYAPNLPGSDLWSESLIETWTGFQLFAAAAKQGGVTPTSTPADVVTGLYGISGTTLDGLTPPLNYVKGQPTVINCYFNQGLENGQWTTPGGSAPVCMDDATAATVNTAFAG